MESKARLLGHPVHQMLIVFPLGLLATAVVFDVLFLFSGAEVFAVVSYWMIFAGLIGGVLAAPFGFIDWLAIPRGTRAKRIGAWHGIGNLIVVTLFLVSLLMRREAPAAADAEAYAFSFAAVLLALFTAWLGGELVDRLGVGVHENAHLDAPSSLRARHHSL